MTREETIERLEARPDLAALETCYRCARPIGADEYEVTEDGTVRHVDCPVIRAARGRRLR